MSNTQREACDSEAGVDKKASGEETKKAEETKDNRRSGKSPGTLPPADFSTLILSLSTSALMHLGEIRNPETQRIETHPAMAKHTIDLIDMLKKKTEGNLTDDEARLIDNILYDLRIRYCKIMEQK